MQDLENRKKKAEELKNNGHTCGSWKFENTRIVTEGDPYGQGQMHIGDVRGWGHLTGQGACNFSEEKAEKIQDANGAVLASAHDLLSWFLEACEEIENRKETGSSLYEVVNRLRGELKDKDEEIQRLNGIISTLLNPNMKHAKLTLL